MHAIKFEFYFRAIILSALTLLLNNFFDKLLNTSGDSLAPDGEVIM
jgi:hypothetical protein